MIDKSQQVLPRLGSPPQTFSWILAKDWIKRCEKSHRHCPTTETATLPRRVLDISSGEPFIYESSGAVHKYATLSHCWEDSQPVKTLKSDLTRRQGRLEWAQLPVAFQEAIEIVKKLGIRYLWIDSLCILQDDPEEWAIESARMANIFENSVVTIVLHQPGPNLKSTTAELFSGNCTYSTGGHSTFSKRQQHAPVVFSVRDHKGHTERTLEEDWIDSSKLSTRGWCFQVSLEWVSIIQLTNTGL